MDLKIAKSWVFLVASSRTLWLMLVGAAAVGFIAARPASGQVTPQMLIGDSVSEVGNYPDVDEAIKRYGNRDFLGARTYLEAAKRKDPSLPPPDLLLAKLHFLGRDEAAGRNALEATVSESPNDPEVFLILADQAIRQGRSVEAEALYEKGLQLTDAFNENAKRKRNFEIRGRTGRAMIAERRKNWAAATDDWRALLKVDPDNATAHYRLGIVLFMQAKTGPQVKAAYDEFREAKRLNPDLPNAFVSTALMYDRLGKNNEAQQAFERAVAEDGRSANTMATYAQWLIKNGSVQKAESALAEARRDNPESSDVLTLSGVAARMAKKMRPAEDYFMEALRISPTNGTVLNQLALLLIDQMDQDKRERALQFAHINSKLNPDNAEAQVTLSWVLYQLGRMSEANAAFRNGVRLGMGNLPPDSSYLVAKMLADQNQNLEMAKRILSSALKAENQGIFVNRQDAQSLLATLERQ